MNIVRVGRVPFTVSNLGRATDTVLAAASAREGLPVRLANAYCVALASSDEKYCSVFNSHGITFPDGTPVVWFMRRRSSAARTVRGPALFERVIDRGRERQIRHFFLGTQDATLEALVAELGRRYPGMECAGTFAPGFNAIDNESLVEFAEKIRDSEADIVWVALGTPKQDFVSSWLAPEVGSPCVGVGAAFDFVAGRVGEAPVWLRETGFEWLYRLLSEPRRLWRRYLIGNSKFLYCAIFQSSSSSQVSHFGSGERR